ncbi:DUF7504 family protein [Natrarchaeobius oligotrophus]|uniref:Recombinase RecA n=1 Tax=Natrarchaeobius chitinivorans TaxID=1679083 RepID=A0A3N6MGY7_NATCH|nr:hypothetical protein [Natrarchaeobius chitinivorans]RQH00295.1 hypothetical protein EA472_10545 [Natrarchaeobius chitinivorans]
MSLSDSEGFAVESLPIENVENGTSILLTGDDTTAPRTVFARLVAADSERRSIVLSTDVDGRTVQRSLEREKSESGNRSWVLTCEGPEGGDEITVVDDIGDLTGLGMEFSSLLASSQQSARRFRAGIFLCSSICREVDDTRSVYRFLNTNFLTQLRRDDGIGVRALDTSAELETDVRSMVAGMETSFSARIDVEETEPDRATLSLAGPSADDEMTTISF